MFIHADKYRIEDKLKQTKNT